MNDRLNLKQTIDEKVNDDKAKEPEVIDTKKASEQEEKQKVEYKVGVTPGGYFTAFTLGGMYFVSKGVKKLWEIAYPPKIKKYIAAATTVAFLYGATHPVSTVKFIGEAKRDAIHWVEGVLSNKKEGDKAKEKATTLEKELNEKDRVVKDLTNKLGENIGLKFRYQKEADIAKRRLGEFQVESSYGKSTEKSEEETLRPYMSPAVTGEEKSMLVRPGATLAGIARDYLGDSSKWRELAEDNVLYVSKKNGNSHVELKVGDKIRFSGKYNLNPNMDYLSPDQIPKYSFIKDRKESLETAIKKKGIGLENLALIREYNDELLPNVDESAQERIWIPLEVAKKIFPGFDQKEIKEYPSRYNK